MTFNYQRFRSIELPTEKNIMSGWKGDIGKPKVSVLCATFNQKIYIEDAIRGFLIQETDFPFEIIIHDDASTDGTADVLKKYADLYPNLISLILQSENQYSQGKKIIPLIATYAHGDYLALCEGDDFWKNKDKLQKQYEILFSTNSQLCFTHALNYLPSQQFTAHACNKGHKPKLFLSDVIKVGGGYMPTASLMIGKTVFKKLPQWFDCAPVGDVFLQILASLNHPAICLPEATTVYRVNAEGSWNLARGNRTKDAIKNDLEQMLNHLNLLLNYEEINEVDVRYRKAFYYLWASDDLLSIKDYDGFKECIRSSVACYADFSFKQKVYAFLVSYPAIIPYLKKIRAAVKLNE